MGCFATSSCCSPPQRFPQTHAMFISTPLGARMQVHFHRDGCLYTMLLSVKSAATLGTDIESTIATVAKECRSNSLIFLTPKDRVASFPDYDCTLWFLSSCPKVPINRVLVYASNDEMPHAFVLCTRYPKLAGLIVNVASGSRESVFRAITLLSGKDEIECPVLLIHSSDCLPNDHYNAFSTSEYIREARKVSKTYSPDEVIKAISDFSEERTQSALLRSVSHNSFKSKKSEYGSLLFRSDQMTRTVTTAPTASRADIDSLVNKYNLMYEIGMTAKRDMTKFKVDVNDLRASVYNYRTLTVKTLESYQTDMLNEVHADLNELLQGVADEESTRELLLGELRDLNLEIRHTYRMIRESLARVESLEGFTGVGKRARTSGL